MTFFEKILDNWAADVISYAAIYRWSSNRLSTVSIPTKTISIPKFLLEQVSVSKSVTLGMMPTKRQDLITHPKFFIYYGGL